MTKSELAETLEELAENPDSSLEDRELYSGMLSKLLKSEPGERLRLTYKEIPELTKRLYVVGLRPADSVDLAGCQPTGDWKPVDARGFDREAELYDCGEQSVWLGDVIEE